MFNGVKMYCPYVKNKVWCTKRNENDDNKVCDSCFVLWAEFWE